MTKQGFIEAFAGDSQYPLCLVEEIGGKFLESIPDERANGRQPGIARASGIMPLLLQVFEKSEDRIGAESIEVDLIDRHSLPFGDEEQQQAERIPIGGDRMDADGLSSAQMPKESLQQHGEFIFYHTNQVGVDGWQYRSKRAAAFFSAEISGCTYQ